MGGMPGMGGMGGMDMCANVVSRTKAPLGRSPLCLHSPHEDLVAEDDAILADGVTRTLRQSGYAVDWVKNGVEADTALATDDFDLLILDTARPRNPGSTLGTCA